MLHSLAARLNRLNDVHEIGEAIASELRDLVDYHNCRVYHLDDDGITLMPVAFRGELTEYQGETLEALITLVGEGLTGHVAETKLSYYAPNAGQDTFAVDIPGTADVDESMLGVPFVFGDRLIGLVILSKLGVDQFDEQDIQLLEVLASHAAVAMENARLFQLERDAARTSGELLKFSQALTTVRDVDAVLSEALAAIPELMPCSGAQAYLKDPLTGAFRLVVGAGEGLEPLPEENFVVSAEVAERFLFSLTEPFLLPKELVGSVPGIYKRTEPREVLVSPLRWEPDGFGALVVAARGEDDGFSGHDLELMRGIADIASLALGNASRFRELEESTDRLRTLDEMKNTFLEAVSHELRTPLSAVLGIALTLARGEVKLTSDEAVDLLERLAANASKLERLLADLLDLDRLARGIVEPNRRPTDVGELVRGVVDSSDFVRDHRVEVEVEPVVVSIDAAKVERIVENLLANAVRHTPAEAAAWVYVRPKSDGVLITVDDEGGGVPSDLKMAIFEPFRQGPQHDRHTPGVGIGLSLVARFAELHGGRAWVEDRPGGGASFRVFIPDAQGAAAGGLKQS